MSNPWPAAGTRVVANRLWSKAAEVLLCFFGLAALTSCATSPNLYQTASTLPAGRFQVAVVPHATYVDEVCGRVLNADGGLSRDCVVQHGTVATDELYWGHFPALRMYLGLTDDVELGGQLAGEGASLMVKVRLVDGEHFDLALAPAVHGGIPVDVTLPLLLAYGTDDFAVFGSVAPILAWSNVDIGSQERFDVVVFGASATLGGSFTLGGVFVRPEVGFTLPIAGILLPEQTASFKADWVSFGVAIGWTVGDE